MVIIPEYHLIGENSEPIFENREVANSNSIGRRLIPDPAGETEIIKYFVNNGYSVVDKSQIEKIRYNKQTKAILNGDTDLAKVLALQYGADLLLIGEAFSQSTGNAFRGLSSCRARIEARMIKSDTGEIIFAGGKFASGLDRSEAIAGKKAIQKAGLELGKECFLKLKNTKPQDDYVTIDLIVTGLKYNDFIVFKKEILSPTDCIKQINKSRYLKDKAILKIDLNCDKDLFCERIFESNLKHFLVDILEISTGEITISAARK